MNHILKGLVAISTVFACVSGSLAVAGGLGSKDKARTPFAAGAFTTIGAHSERAPRYLSKKQRTQMKISANIRKNIRTQARTLSAPKNTAKRELFSNSTVFVNPQLQIDRQRLVARGKSSQPMHCAKLHTHERAICQRDAQLRKNPQWVKLAFGK